jgi:tol-pal system protein YbgF
MLIRAFFLLLMFSCNVSYAGLFGDDKAREQVTALRNQVEEMEARIAKMEEALKSQALLKLYTQVETLGLELGRLNGQVEMLSNDNSLLQKRQKDFYIDLDNRLRRIEQPDTPTSAPLQTKPANPSGSLTTPLSEPPDAPPVSVSTAKPALISESYTPGNSIEESMSSKELTPAGPAANSAYETAYNSFKDGNYAESITQFERFLENYPQSSLAPGAAYWIGNARYALRDFQQAIDAQQRLLSTYPDSPKAPDALLNIASSQHEMGDNKASKHTLEDLIAKHPLSEAAKKAKQRLANIK